METSRVLGANLLWEIECPFWDDTAPASLWQHCTKAFEWVIAGIGLGRHGLIKIAEGDWNDYLSRAGVRGEGESVMNSGMACRAFSLMLDLARIHDADFARRLAPWLEKLRAAVSNAFEDEWFVRGYDDDGKPFGSSAEGRLFINAQSWSALGGCGTPEMRRTALLNALQHFASPIGLTLLSRPYPCPPPLGISIWPIPPGDGENGGIWPQTVHWFIWALAEHGLTEEAEELWKRISLRNHASLHPEVPFGIFNGPDCYSSHHSNSREGWTQVEMIDRASHPPMNPMIAWSAFSLRKIESSKQGVGAGKADRAKAEICAEVELEGALASAVS